ncbi:hypothetical protein [Polaromonas sp.]|jgi:hypothetical protein|uniref:hypothetical protein n=1 Tax=Polaromonas sp. TaxID=1869339 RepID=UPI002C329643|nr:hypothetical protein [Polaromonas sp.]HQS33741.1 hypothetical protein [Polaromonas sp.]HQS92963.1 hypothetical protein [Polaromonas sp.]
MMDRCYNPDCKSYPDYGGRGIAVCKSWHDIATFVAELPPGYKSGLEIDRIDNDGHYQPGNVRWATRRKNTGNRRSARLLDFNGRTQSMTDWAAELGMSVGTLWTRIEKEGWSVERALTDPVISRVEAVARGRAARWGNHTKALKPPPRVLKRVEYNGMSVTVAELSAMTGIPIAILRKRIFERGWSIDRAATTPI